jgi:hypothetical protein
LLLRDGCDVGFLYAAIQPQIKATWMPHPPLYHVSPNPPHAAPSRESEM